MSFGDRSQTQESTLIRSLGDVKVLKLGNTKVFSAGKSLRFVFKKEHLTEEGEDSGVRL